MAGVPRDLNGVMGETEEERASDEALKHRPWSTWEYERVRLAAKDVLNSLIPIPTVDGVAYVVNGKVRWELMGALDRASERREGQTGKTGRKKT
jgi:hypothetical protein